jgi:hypothetical protein
VTSTASSIPGRHVSGKHHFCELPLTIVMKAQLFIPAGQSSTLRLCSTGSATVITLRDVARSRSRIDAGQRVMT